MKRLGIAIILTVLVNNLFGQQDLSVGSSFQLFLQRQNTHGDAWILHNAEFSQDNDLLKWKTTHSSFGARGIRFNYSSGGGIYFYADNNSTVSGTNFTPTTRFFIGNNGNVGIGTTAPQSKLDLGNGTGGHSIVWGGSNGTAHYASIGTMYSSAYLVSGVGIKLSTSSNNLLYSYSGAMGVAGILQNLNGDTYFFNQVYASRTKDATFDWTANTKMVIKSNGNVGIGTTNPQYKFSVKGTIGCGEVKVEDVSSWADFVFHPSYKLRTLGEVEQFIKTNNHLPEIPTESEVKQNGIGLGEMNAKLLQKIEELTLYMIEQNNKMDQQQEQINELREQNNMLVKEIQNIKK